jgi:hypothetical protein
MIESARCRRGVLVAVLLAVAFSSVMAAQKPAPAPKKNPLLKLIEPWPSPEALAKRRLASESLPLFSATEPFAFTLVADFKTINKDRKPESRTRYPGELRVAGEGGGQVTLPVQLSARGHSRRNPRTCDYVPLRIEFPKKGAGKTPFARQEALKLVVQCAKGGDFEQYLLREYLAYRLSNLITHKSFRARLATVTYVDQVTGKPAGTRHAMLIEDEGDVARRLEGRVVNLPRMLFKDVDTDTLMPMMIFEYMIGNTDFSIYALHNVKLVQRPDKSLHPVAYDFDFSGLVHTPYAAPDRALMLGSVRDRLYRGPCRRPEQVDRHIATFAAKKDLLRALPDSIPGIDKASRDDARSYLDDFFSSIKSAKDARRVFVDCTDKSTM